ncbi:VanZ family protein [Actinomadura meyerae]|uniref:VanZ family protein n=1 Tax=Actinomadura meyerae TaxID=240840 RepID=UPI001FE32728|nr:VanZ family protein [Actinomadura meyerae]
MLVEMWQPAAPGERVPRYVLALRVLAVLAALGLLGVFFYFAFRLTLTPVHDNGQAGGNTDPGRSLRFYLDRPTKEAVLQIGGNLALLAPLGVLLPIVWTTLRGPIRLALVTGVLSLTIEAIQGALVVGRAFDVDDVILNVTGVVLAYLILGRRLSRTLRGT